MTKCAVIIDNRHIPGLEDVIMAHELRLPMEWQVWHIANEPIHSLSDYNRLLTSKRFWRNMPDKVLIFQFDSMLLRDGIEDFMEYDYIGAPIKHCDFPIMNGGLSLRDSKAMLKVINHVPYQGEQEDVYFCRGLQQLGGKLPTREIADQFSTETIYKLGTLGFHAIDKWLAPIECQHIRGQYD